MLLEEESQAHVTDLIKDMYLFFPWSLQLILTPKAMNKRDTKRAVSGVEVIMPSSGHKQC